MKNPIDATIYNNPAEDALAARAKPRLPHPLRKTIAAALLCSVVLCGALTILPSCAPIKATRGNLVADEQVKEVIPGTHHQADVMRILGTPTSKSIFDDNVWYYVGLKTEQSAFFDPDVREKRILSVTFDEGGLVSGLSEIDHEGYEVPISGRITPTSGQDLTVIQQLLGNVGRFNPQSSQ